MGGEMCFNVETLCSFLLADEMEIVCFWVCEHSEIWFGRDFYE